MRSAAFQKLLDKLDELGGEELAAVVDRARAPPDSSTAKANSAKKIVLRL